MKQPPVIELNQVCFRYQQGPYILDHVDLSVQEKDFLGIVGPNGGGKSTLLRILLGLLKPTSGSVEVLGLSPQQASSQIGYVPQYVKFWRDFPITVGEVVLQATLTRRLLGGTSQNDRKIAREALEKLQIAHLSKHAISDLSGGQLGRVLIARALACQPKILVLDEPTANIDPHGESEFFEFLKKLNQEVTVLVVSHDIGFISHYVKHVACLNRSLVCHESSSLSAESLQELYGTPVKVIQHHSHAHSHSHSHKGKHSHD